ncbi:HNH endonuclease [Paeniglutamicibacter sp. NPDC012692]|uniref:HNH endonuclease n=1 Tax=Paeniglutamicibacter sp. NPDC012692 TaxID=3364388 RepID=UPI003674D3F4
MTTRSETGGLGGGSETGPEDLTYEYLAEQGIDLRLFLQQALNAEGIDGLRAISAALDHTRISTASYERVESIAALEELKSSACALQAKTTCVYDDEVAERRAAKGERALNPSWGVGPEIAFARHQPPRTGAQYLDFCHVLTDDLVFSYDALHRGVITEAEAFIVVKETRGLTPEQRGEIDIRLFSEGHQCFGLGGKKLAAMVREWALAYGSEKEVDLEANAAKERYISIFPIDRHRMKITGILPTEYGVLISQVLESLVSSAKVQGDDRSRQHLAVDSLLERLTGLDSPTAIPIQLGLVMTDRTLFQGHSEPALLQGYGIISAQKARMLIKGSEENPNELELWLRRLYTAPGTGDLIAMDSAQRLFTGGLKKFINIRDQFCRSPFCDSPIRHLDHVVQAARGGPTSVENSGGSCVFCNQTKECPGWKEETIPGPRHTKRVTTFSGHTYESTALPLPGTNQYNVRPASPHNRR